VVVMMSEYKLMPNTTLMEYLFIEYNMELNVYQWMIMIESCVDNFCRQS